MEFSYLTRANRIGNTTWELGRIFPVPSSETTLVVSYGRPFISENAASFLDGVEIEVLQANTRFGPHASIPIDGFDHSKDGFEFSTYSPPESPRKNRMTWAILRDVLEGVVAITVKEGRQREVIFKVEHGPSGSFIGYGHFISKRPQTLGQQAAPLKSHRA